MTDLQNVARDLQRLVQSIGFGSIDANTILKRQKATKKLTSAGVLNISECEGTGSLSSDLLSPGMAAMVKSVLVAGLYPNIAKTTHQVLTALHRTVKYLI